MIKWFNDNEGFRSAILSTIGVLISGIAIWISSRVSIKQNRIELFDKKFEVFKSLEDYFNNSKGWPKSVSLFLTPGVRFQSDNVWAPEINEIVGKASLLFSDALCQKLVAIKNKYSEIRHLDSSISSYFTLLKDHPKYSEISPKFIDYLSNNSPTAEQEEEFMEICSKSKITAEEPVGDNEFEFVTYNFCDLCVQRFYRAMCTQSKCHQRAECRASGAKRESHPEGWL